MSGPGENTIHIIRRKKVIVPHHGGSWKIAFADFMTALMALFLVMWLLSTASEEQLDAVSEYFSTPLLVAMAGGDKSTASNSAIPGGGPDSAYSEGERARIDTRQFNRPAETQRNFNQLQRELHMQILQDPELWELRKQVKIYEIPEGLLIQVLDSDQRPMFERGSDAVEPYMRNLLRTLAPILNAQPNKISISGHTDAHPYPGDNLGYSNWELSTDRANASRREMMLGGLSQDKLLRIVGMADQVTMAGTNPTDAVNRRIELVVLADDDGMAGAGIDRVPSVIELPFD